MKTDLKKIKKFISKQAVFLCIFIFANALLFINILLFHSKVGFHTINYETNAHHFLEDYRTKGEPFDLLNSLGQYDAQWYLKIASQGYPKRPKTPSMQEGETMVMDGFAYAFFPLYPAIVSATNYLVGNVELSAFLVSISFFLASFVSLIYVATKHFNRKISLRTSFLFFFFPFSIFFRSYYAEGIFLFLLVWFAYFLSEKKFLKASVFLSFVSVTKGTAFLLIPVFLYFVYKEARKKKMDFSRALLIVGVLAVPMAVWSLYNYLNTGNPLYFLAVRPLSGVNAFTRIPFLSILHNIAIVVMFPVLPWHAFHLSKIDVLVLISFLFLLVKSRKMLPKSYWLVALCLWLSPLLVKDMMCYSRFQSVNFPVFIYLAQVLKGKTFLLVFVLFFLSLLATSLFFINWWWVG